MNAEDIKRSHHKFMNLAAKLYMLNQERRHRHCLMSDWIDEADEWYAREAERLGERAPA